MKDPTDELTAAVRECLAFRDELRDPGDALGEIVVAEGDNVLLERAFGGWVPPTDPS